jgi:2-polyprenyl-3-methyl-5-hydroxy-6-metoxy-1,4-benzoquinol methylase
MHLKPDWETWLHNYKKQEIEHVFESCCGKFFQNSLELGAGDGYQSDFLAEFTERLVSTDINEKILTRKSAGNIEYRICRAEEAPDIFPQKSFDMIFSSNLLEHVNDPVQVLEGIYKLLKDDGIIINIMPSPFWKLCHVALYVPANCLAAAEFVLRKKGSLNRLRETRYLLKEFLRGLATGTNDMMNVAYEHEISSGNNRDKSVEKPSFVNGLFFPRPHGISESNIAEFTAFGKKRWQDILKRAGFTCIEVKKGPLASGYGLGWSSVGNLAEIMGFTSEYIYMSIKTDSAS